MPFSTAEPSLFVAARGWGYRLSKRAMDVVLGGLLLVLASPVILLAAVLVRLEGRGPIIFRQTRAGLNGKPFTMYKFRSMCPDAEALRSGLTPQNEQTGPVFKIRKDPRVTAVGKFLRRSSIDELPQLINVLKGQMSLVGPRPLWIEEWLQSQGIARARVAVKPGLSCLWQISGRSELTYSEWVLLDLYYIRHRSLLVDLLILLQTVPAVLSARGAY
jgi:lipopolysaccharide/colanic/teichoic acid biosynthesis glycosyltransferase